MIEVMDFEREVLERSRSKPVLVDFWAPWCGPCRQLGPVLERLEKTRGDEFDLVKVNTDENPEVSSRYGIRSIPAVKLFVDGEVQDEFIGALPERQVETWLSNALPSESKRAVQQAESLIDDGNVPEAIEVLDRVLVEDPANAPAAMLKATLVLFSEPATAAALAREAMRQDANQIELGKAITQVAAVLDPSWPEELPDGNGQASMLEAATALRQEEIELGLDALIRSVSIDRKYADEAARKTAIALFTILGRDNPLTKTYQRRLQMALF